MKQTPQAFILLKIYNRTKKIINLRKSKKRWMKMKTRIKNQMLTCMNSENRRDTRNFSETSKF